MIWPLTHNTLGSHSYPFSLDSVPLPIGIDPPKPPLPVVWTRLTWPVRTTSIQRFSYPFNVLTPLVASAPPVDYYKILEINPNANQAQIREAYKRQALKHHPDRVPTDSPERSTRTKRFQQINDAYYTLSDATRRRDYDTARAFHNVPSSSGTEAGSNEGTTDEETRQAPGAFPWSTFFSGTGTEQEEETRSNAQFGSVFEEMLREEGMASSDSAPTGKFWSIVGGLSGGAMGFIVANFPGAIAGAVAGNRLGAIRDAKGKSVYAVFQELPQSDKAKLLSELAAKVFAQAVGSS